MLTAERLRHVITYDPENGDLIWLRPTANRHKPGDIAGSLNGKGRLVVMIDGINYQAGRLIWLYVTGAFPDCFIDHENRIKTDNRWKNLRKATPVQNGQNRLMHINNTSGETGVTIDTRHAARHKPYVARLQLNGKNKYLGNYATLEEAKQAREKAELELFGEFSPLATKEMTDAHN